MALSFPGTTGRGVRIAVIDSGVHPAHPHIDGTRLLGGVAITREGRVEDDLEAILDRLGHGTAVSAAIQQGAPGADLLTVRVFREALRASAVALIAAIDWAIAAKADIINLSLGSTNAAHRDAFAHAAARADDAGIVLVAAHAVDGVPCWPGALPSVLGVALDPECPIGACRAIAREGRTVFAAAGVPRSIDGVPPRLNLYGVSFAVARMSGFAALALEALRSARGDATGAQDVREALVRAAD
ncbi:hypothetical protein NX02_15500 [Sphingomonas sanxanigenens DSM 19645 = NX02]|uniref:Peptidase S8/S53 domain-containing protein n=2 Tax=Sphingomonas sanxanigenens TaxID=397260 RepID=W0ACG4_9SPHN|nr:hypothetical protein NX02_15500 [Sphingomonas sanxanigenens DSM 19645 = NX02]